MKLYFSISFDWISHCRGKIIIPHSELNYNYEAHINIMKKFVPHFKVIELYTFTGKIIYKKEGDYLSLSTEFPLYLNMML